MLKTTVQTMLSNTFKAKIRRFIMVNLLWYLYVILFFAIPIASVILFVISIYRYISAKKKNKAVPNTYSDNEIKKRKIMLIVMSVIVAILVTIVVGFIILLCIAIVYM